MDMNTDQQHHRHERVINITFVHCGKQ